MAQTQFGNFGSGNSNVKTYNPRYPGFDEEDMRKLESLVADIQDPSKKQDQMDYLYRAFYDTVQNEHKIKERSEMLNQQTYEVGNITDTDQKKQAETKLKLSELAQQIKQTYNINANANDGEVLNLFIEQTPNGQQLLQNYINNGDKELLYVGGLAKKQIEDVEIPEAQGGGAMSLVNNPNTQNMFWDKETTAGNILDMMNIIGEGAEDIDNVVNRYIPTITGEKSTNNLADRINNLSEEEIAEYRKQYDKLVSEGKLKGYTTQVVGDNLVEQVWNSIFGKKSGKKYTDVEKGFTSWLIDQNANLGQFMIGANDELKGISSPNVVKFFSNIPGSAIKTLTATIRGMTNPYDTLVGLIKLVGTKEGHQALKARYGSWEALANALNTDPVGVADDILSITQMAGGLTQKVGKLTGLKGVENFGGYVNTNIGSATDALAGKAIGGGKIMYGTPGNTKTIDVNGIYGTIDNKLINSSNKLVSDAGKYMEATSNVGKAMEYGPDLIKDIKEIPSKATEGIAERMSGNKSAQDKLFQAQEPTLNRLSKERNTKNIRNKADTANKLIIEDIKKYGGELPTDTQTRVDAHERAMNNKWNEITQALGDNKSQMVSTTELADKLDKYIADTEKLGISKNKSDLSALKEQSADLRNMGQVDLLTLEKMKEMINANLNDWDDKSIGNVYKNGMTELTQNIGKIEDQIISEIPGEFQGLKNEFGALKDGYGDVVKANVKAQRAKYGDTISNYSRIKGIGDMLKGIVHFDLGELSKGATQVIGGDITAKLRDKDWLIRQGFEDLAKEMNK